MINLERFESVCAAAEGDDDFFREGCVGDVGERGVAFVLGTRLSLDLVGEVVVAVGFFELVLVAVAVAVVVAVGALSACRLLWILDLDAEAPWT